MAKYYYRGTGLSLFAAQAGGDFQTRMLYQTAGEFGFLNPDGSKTYYYGEGLVWDNDTGSFTVVFVPLLTISLSTMITGRSVAIWVSKVRRVSLSV